MKIIEYWRRELKNVDIGFALKVIKLGW